MLITIGGQKGGTGKTTVAVNFAIMRALEKRDILLFDIDPQSTSTLCLSRRDQNEIEPRIQSNQKILDKKILSPGIVIRNEIKALLPRYSDIIIDAGGADNEVLRAAITLSDIVIFPVTPSEFDMWTFSNASKLVSEAQSKDSDLRGYILLSKVSTQPQAARQEIAECDDFLTDYENLIRLKSIIYQRKPIRTASANGMSIVEHKPVDQRAIDEFTAVYREVFCGQ